MAVVNNELSFPFDMWDTLRTLFLCFLAMGMFSIVFSQFPCNCSDFQPKLCPDGAVWCSWGTSGWSYLPVLISSSSELFPVTLWDTVISTMTFPHVRGPASLANCWVPFWLDLQRSCRWEQCPRAPVMFLSFPHRPGCGAGTTWTVCSLHWEAAGPRCHQLCCFPTVPLPTRIADSWESFLNCTGLFHMENVLLLETSFVSSQDGGLDMFAHLPESSQASKEAALLCFPAGTQHCWGGQWCVPAAPELTVHFRDLFCDLFVLTPWLRVAESFTSQDCSRDGDRQSWTEEGFGSPLFTVNF